MKTDIHCHVFGKGGDLDNIENEIFFNPDDNNSLLTRALYPMMEKSLEKSGADTNSDDFISEKEYFDYLYRQLKESKELDGIVLLAMDALYSPKTGELDRVKTDLCVSNKYLSRIIDKLNEKLYIEGPTKIFFLGASVSPNRPDWESELNYVLTQTNAALIKLIPSVQHIKMWDPKHKPYWEMLADYDIPLLCHVGPEYAFPEGPRMKKYDNFRYLENPLKYGVKVIAAHCATPVIPFYDKDETKAFLKFMKSANKNGIKLWADTSALTMATRIHLLRKVIEDFPDEWLMHGSDFPVPIDGWIHLPHINPDISKKEYLEFKNEKNPFDLDVKIKRACGFADSILTNWNGVLKIALD